MTSNIAIRDNSTITDKRQKPMWDLTEMEPKRYPSATAFAKEKGIPLSTVYQTLNGYTHTCHRRVISYDENVAETQSKMVRQISTLNNKHSNAEKRVSELERELSEAKQKAALWDAYQKEQEEARKAEEKRTMMIAKAEAKLERRRRMVENIDDKLQLAVRRMMEAEKELADLKEGENK